MHYYETDRVNIIDNPEIGCVHFEWKNFTDSEEFRAAMQQGLNLLVEKKYTRVLSDTRKLGPIAPDDQEWILSHWLPKALEVGYNRIALIVPEDVFTQISVTEILEQSAESSSNLEDKYFQDIDSACEWLKN